MNKLKLINHLQDQDERFAMTRVLDLAEKVLVNHGIAVSDFYDPHLLSLANDILRGIPDLKFEFAGGYEEAERKRILICRDYYQPDFDDFNLGCVKIEGKKDFAGLTHRDFLGAILGLGLKREKLGDIIVGEQAAFCIMTKELAEYVSSHLTKVGKIAVATNSLTDFANKLTNTIKYKEIRTTVASLRLDSVSSHGFSISRSQIVPAIKGGKVKLNWKEVTNPSQEIREGDMISYRGHGRVLVRKVLGNTRKGRIGILLNRLR